MSTIDRFLSGSLAAGLLLVPALSAQGSSQVDLKRKYEEKLSHEFVDFGGWITDYDEARAKAKAEGKVLFVYFSRSYAP